VRVAVTGASGFIGRHVVEHLTARGDGAVPIRRPFEPSTLTAAFRETDAVVHLAGVVSAIDERTYIAANVDNTRIVATAAALAGRRLVHISSLAAAGPAPPTAPRSEDDPLRPVTAYGRSKLAGERLLDEVAALQWIALRPGVVYGDGDRALLPFFRMATRGFLPLVGRIDAAYTVVHISDVVRAIVAAIDSKVRGEAMFVGHPVPASVRDIVDGVRAAIAPHARIVRLPMPIIRAAAVAGDLVGRVTGRRAIIDTPRYVELSAEGFACRVDRLRDRLGVVAQVELREGLARTAEWYQRAGWV
jgi:nucleoside-diphosphate-sugar epimerase